MTNPNQAAQEKRAKLLLDLGVLIGGASFLYGLYLIYRPLAPLVGGLLLIAGCGFAGYDRFRRGDR